MSPRGPLFAPAPARYNPTVNGSDTPAFGIDFGGSGIKGAPVDLAIGEFSADRVRIETPRMATPRHVVKVVAELVEQAKLPADGTVGITVPGVVKNGVVHTAANIDPSWVGTDAQSLFADQLERRVTVVNDADAAGLAETRYGAAKGVQGLVVVTTLGTGIGSALIHQGALVPNSELGHLEVDGHDAESRAANSVRERKDLSWKAWAKALTRYYRAVEAVLSPDLFVIGGGVSKHAERFVPLIEIDTPIVPARLKNSAGIIGAALLAHEQGQAPSS
jgi:polyphosphate glucokinase